MLLYSESVVMTFLASINLLGPQDNPQDAVGRFVTHYHAKPAPELVPQMLELILKKNALGGPQAQIGGAEVTVAHAFGHMARGNPKLVRLFESSFPEASHKGKAFLLNALRISGDETTLKNLQE